MAVDGGLIQIKSNAQLVAEENARKAAERESERRPELKALAAHIKVCFETAKQHRDREVTARLQDCKRRRDGKYDATKLAEIKQRGGPDTYYNLTDTKCDAAEAWAQDVFTKAVDSPWSLEPTPIPDLPKNLQEDVIERVTTTVRQALDAGNNFAPADIIALTDEVRDQMLKQLRDIAKERAARMTVKMEDQLAEGGYDAAFDDALKFLCTYPVGILKGPVIENVKRMRWNNDRIALATEPIPRFHPVNPFDFYPGPNARKVNDSYVCETMHLSRSDLMAMKGAPGYSAKFIDAAVASRALPAVDTDTDRATSEGRDLSQNEGLPAGALPAIEFWGAVQGGMLQDWGMEKARVPEPLNYYEITAILVGDYVVKAILNPDPLGNKPYFATSYIRRAGEIWGDSIPEKMGPEQDAANACMRNLVTNLGMASGPQMAVDLDAKAPEVSATDVYPFKVWQYHGQQLRPGRKPVDWFQPSSNAAELLKVAEFFEQKCDDRTQIPRYQHGNADVKGAGETYGGMALLMNAAAKGIKRTIKNIDRDIVRPLIEKLYQWNLVNLPDEEFGQMKGDCRVVARGAIAAIIQEQTDLKRLDFLKLTQNDLDMQIVGILGRAAVLRKVAERLDLDVSEIVPDTDELIARLRQQAEQAAQAPAQEDTSGGTEKASAP